MMGVWAVFKLNLERAIARKSNAIITIGMSLLAVLVVVVLLPRLELNPTVAYIAGDGTTEQYGAPVMQWFRFERLNEAPKASQLVRNRYDAVVVDYGDGHFEIMTFKSDRFRAQLEDALLNGEAFTPDRKSVRGVGANIVGYLVMFVLMSGAVWMTLYADDKASGTFRRIVTSPVGFGIYLTGQVLFNFLMLFVPIILLLALMHTVFHVEIGFSYAQYVLLLSLLTALSSAFGWFMASMIESSDNALAMASAIAILMSLLAGSFFPLEHSGAVMTSISRLFPQRSLIEIAHGFEQNVPLSEMIGHGLYVVFVSLVLFAWGSCICERRLRGGRY